VLSFFLSKPEHHIFHIHNIYFIIIEKLFPTRSRGPASASGTTTEKRAHTKGAGSGAKSSSGAKKDDSLRGAASAIDATTGGSLPASTTIKKMVSIACNSKFKNSILYQNIYIVFFI
jgi:hypothetical protein